MEDKKAAFQCRREAYEIREYHAADAADLGVLAPLFHEEFEEPVRAQRGLQRVSTSRRSRMLKFSPYGYLKGHQHAPAEDLAAREE